MYRVNIRTNSGRRCAFCKFWEDAEDKTITPRDPELGLWEFDPNKKNQCTRRNSIKMATDFCIKFECKL